MFTLTRRAFVALAAAFMPAVRLRARAQSAISPEDFLRLSQRLVGRPKLDAEIASIYLTALAAVPANVPRLAALAANAPARPLTPAHAALEQTIVEWWYTGIYTVNGEPRLATHTGALMWSTLGMPAPGTCATTFGAWSQPPRRS